MTLAALGAESSEAQAILHVAFELSKATWKVGFTDGKKIWTRSVGGRDLEGLQRAFIRARDWLKLSANCRVVSCYEAGRDGFWLHRWLISEGVENVIVEPASLQVDRRARRVKTDRLDLQKLMSSLVRFTAGDADVWRVVRVPSEEAEDRRVVQRDREGLQKESTRHKNRMRSRLFAHGVDLDPAARDFRASLDQVRRWDGSPLPHELKRAILRELERYEHLRRQVGQIDMEEKKRVEAAATETDEKIARLTRLRGVGITTAAILGGEFFGWRNFKNRREVASLAGLTGTPYDSGGTKHEQGISKAGNRHVRRVIVEAAWCWLRWQPDSKLTRSFRTKTSLNGGSRNRRIQIVALARRLLIAFWHYLEHGVVPEGAIMSA